MAQVTRHKRKAHPTLHHPAGRRVAQRVRRYLADAGIVSQAGKKLFDIGDRLISGSFGVPDTTLAQIIPDYRRDLLLASLVS